MPFEKKVVSGRLERENARQSYGVIQYGKKELIFGK